MDDTQLNFEFEVGNHEKYKVNNIQNCTVYAKKFTKLLSSIYYLVSWKNYPKDKNTWELALVI